MLGSPGDSVWVMCALYLSHNDKHIKCVGCRVVIPLKASSAVTVSLYLHSHWLCSVVREVITTNEIKNLGLWHL